MNMTNSAGEPAKSASETVRPSIFGNEKSGAFVPNGSIVLGVKTMMTLLVGSGLFDELQGMFILSASMVVQTPWLHTGRDDRFLLTPTAGALQWTAADFEALTTFTRSRDLP
jgi:hypothetical protein